MGGCQKERETSGVCSTKGESPNNRETVFSESKQSCCHNVHLRCFFFFFSFFFSPKKLEFYLANSAFVNVYFTLQVKSDLTKLRAERRQQKKR